jgi:DNA-binding NarL/FixJ family response regulator
LAVALTRLLIVDDQALFRQALPVLITDELDYPSLIVVPEAGHGQEAVEKAIEPTTYH